MWTRQRRRTHLTRLIVPAIACAVSLYFWNHSQTGRYGSVAQQQVVEELAKANSKLSELSDRRQALERDVQLLRDGTIERDVLDERARALLGMVGQFDVVLIAN